MTDLAKYVPPIGTAETTKFLVTVSGFGFVAAAFVIWPWLILSVEHREALIEWLSPPPLVPWVLAPMGGVAAIVVAWALFYFLEIHESLYDRFFVKWRVRHDRDFLLPRLFAPFRDQLYPEHLRAVQADSRKYVDRIFCPFISGQFPIPRETVKRFYRALAWYWVSQLLEIFILVTLLLIYGYAIWGRATAGIPSPHQADLLTTSAGVVALALANNLWLVRKMRRALRVHSEAEINEILYYSRPQLEELVLTAARDGGFLRAEFATPRRGWAATHDGQDLPPAKARIYLAAPMRSLDEEEYGNTRALMIKLSEVLRRFPAVHSVHYPGTSHQQAKPSDALMNLNAGLRELGRSDILILYYPRRVASSVLFEAGYALARGKQVIIMVRDPQDLPSILRAARQLTGVREFVCPDEPSAFDILSDIFGDPKA